MLAFLRKSIERSDEAVTPEERLLERRLVEGILKREQKEKESGLVCAVTACSALAADRIFVHSKKYSKKDKSKKKSKPASLLATSKRYASRPLPLHPSALTLSMDCVQQSEL